MTAPYRQQGWRTVQSFTVEFWFNWISAPTGGTGHVSYVGMCNPSSGTAACGYFMCNYNSQFGTEFVVANEGYSHTWTTD